MTRPEPFVPYNNWTTPPDKQTVVLRCIDMSNIYVPVSNDGSWWYIGNRLPVNQTVNGWTMVEVGSTYPLPYQVWPEKVFWLPQSWQRKYINNAWGYDAFPVLYN